MTALSESTAQWLVYYVPHVATAATLVCVWRWRIPEKRRFVFRTIVAIGIAVLLAHANRLLGLVPAYLDFPSGHMTLCLCLAASLLLLRPWTLVITLPLLAAMGVALVHYHFHSTVDVLGAVPLVLMIYALAFHNWTAAGFRPLDSGA